jgi:STE24 endopeptidase
MGRVVRLHLVGMWLCVSVAMAGGWPSQSRAAHTENMSRGRASVWLGALSVARVHRQANSSGASRNDEYRLSRDRYEQAVAYSRASYTLYFGSYGLVVGVLLVILWSGVAARYRDWAERATDKRWMQGFIFVPLLLLTVDLLELPLRAYWHSLSLRYQMSVQPWGSWFVDWSKERGLMLGFGLIVALGLAFLIRKSPRRWWLYSWAVALPLAAFFVFIAPWFIDPLFNTFEPLEATQPELVASIAKLTQRAGVPIPADRMFLMKASQKTNAIDAYVTGLGASQRVVIWDTTIRKTTPDETLYIVGHELGHYVLGHIWKGFLFFAVLLFAGCYALFRALHWALGRWSGEWRIYGAEDWASFAVLFLLVEMGIFIAAPIGNAFSRMQEHAADVYGLEVTHGIIPNSAEVAARSFQILGEQDLADPDPSPFITWWLYSHPPLAERLAFAYDYDPWDKGEPPKYVQ